MQINFIAMNKLNFEKRTRYRFILLFSLLAVLIGSLLVATFRANNTENLNEIISELSGKRHEVEQVESAIKLLYAAENNFRTFVLTGNRANFRQYSSDLKTIEKIFHKIEKEFVERDDLPGLFKDKMMKTGTFIKARLLADSLIKNSVSWDTTSIYTGLYTEQYKPQAVLISRVDTVISSPQKKVEKKRLLGRLKDAISNKKKEDSNRSDVKVIKSTVSSSIPQPDPNATKVKKAGQKVIADLREMTLSLKQKEFELLESNNRLFGEIKDFLEELRRVEVEASRQRNISLSNNAGSSLKNLSTYNTWQFIVILLLIGCVAGTLYWIYRNDLRLIREARAAELYARLKTEFVSTTSHEIRSPLYVMQLYTEQLADEHLSDSQRSMVTGLVNSAKMTLAIANQILDTIEVEYKEIKLARFEPEKTIADVISTLSIFSVLRNISLKADITLPSQFAIIGDEFKLRQILINLISNAFKFTKKGKIAVKCSMTDDHATNLVWLKVSVEDTGEGIPEPFLKSVFEQFTYLNGPGKSDASMKSNGLGLYIVKKIIDEHGGKIGIESQVGVGSKFIFEIPYQKVPSREAEAIVG